MSKFIIVLDGEIEQMLLDTAKSKNMSPEEFISQIISRFLPALHNINQEDMAKGYQDMAEINLSLAK